MRILVTGAAGFVGFHTCMRLFQERHCVVGLDNFCSYYSVDLKKDRAKLLRDKGIVIVNEAVQDQRALQQLVEEHEISHIIHLAAQAGVRYSLKEPKVYLESNVDGFLSVLETVRAHPHITTLWASSSSVYGTNKKVPFSEEDRTDSPANLYGATKKSNELMAHAYHHLFGLKLVGLRFFTVYGPWGRPDMAYFFFADKIMKGETIELFGHGKLRRDFTYIDDVLDGIYAAVGAPKPYDIYNLGNSHPETVLDLVQFLETSLGKKARVELVDRPLEDIEETFAECSHAKKDLGFDPKISLQEGIKRFSEWFKKYYKYD
jgi:UDP-glucuronate 4-epimerase